MLPRRQETYHNTSHILLISESLQGKQTHTYPLESSITVWAFHFTVLFKMLLFVKLKICELSGETSALEKITHQDKPTSLFLLGHILFWDNVLITSEFSVTVYITALCLGKYNDILCVMTL